MIRHVRICNYKSIREVSVTLDPLTVLIGRSGTGKTNFVESLRFFRDAIVARGLNVLPKFGGWERVLPASESRETPLSVEVSFTAPRAAELYHYSFTFGPAPLHPRGVNLPSTPTVLEEKLSLGNRVLFHQAKAEWSVAPTIVAPPRVDGTLMLGALNGIPEITRAFLLLARGIGWYAFPDNVLLPPTAVQPGHPGIPPAQPQSDEVGLSDNGANYMRAFNAILDNTQSWVRQDEMLAALRQINHSVTSVEPNMPERDKIVVGHQLAGGVLTLDLGQESEGFRRFLAYLLALYQVPPKQTLIFEEPEKGIHPGALALLAEELKACPEAGRGQVIMTTHSPDLLDHFPPEALRVVDMTDGATRIAPVEKEQCEAVRERLLHTGELLTVDPARPELSAAKDA